MPEDTMKHPRVHEQKVFCSHLILTKQNKPIISMEHREGGRDHDVYVKPSEKD